MVPIRPNMAANVAAISRLRELTEAVAVGFRGEIRWDHDKPDRIPAGGSASAARRPWARGPASPWSQGLAATIADYIERRSQGVGVRL
jgi:hypothetical protein